MQPESSLPYSQAPGTCPYPEPTTSSPHNPFPTSSRSILILSSHLRLGLPNGLFPSGFPTKTLCTPLPSSIRATCPAHLILLHFITRTILCALPVILVPRQKYDTVWFESGQVNRKLRSLRLMEHHAIHTVRLAFKTWSCLPYVTVAFHVPSKGGVLEFVIVSK